MDKVQPTPPLSRSYWIDEHLIAGVYPGAATDGEAQEKVRALVAARVALFVDLTDSDDRLRPYEPLLAAIDNHESAIDERRLPGVCGSNGRRCGRERGCLWR